MKRLQQKIIPLEGRRATYGIQRASSTTNAELLSRMLPCSTLTSNEIAERCSIILSEMDRCKRCHSKYIQSNVLHDNITQTFLPDDLYVELENELNRLLTEQILRDERFAIAGTTPDIIPNNNQIIEEISLMKVDTNLCLACNSQCTFLPCYGVNALSNRKQVLHDELKSCKQTNTKTIQSVVARSAINGGETTFVRTDLIKELTDEMQMIDSKLYLAKMDKELHYAYASNEPEIVVRSIHNFPMTLKRRDGILALEHEVNRLIAQLVSTEIVEGVLEWMLRGWYFGVIDTPDSSCPSRKKPYTSHDQRGSLIDKASSIQLSSNANNALHQARENDSSSEELKEKETTMRYGLFCLTFAYFKALHVVRKEKKVWDGSNDLCSLRHDAPMSEERKKIIEEKKNAEFRRARIESAMAKARAGVEKKRQRLQKERLEKIKIRQWHKRQEQYKERLAITLQRVWRGNLGRRNASELALQRERTEYNRALWNASATNIARMWRGYCGRIDAGYLRSNMAQFLFAIRDEEVKDEEEEYRATTNRLLLLHRQRLS